jgi:hypothetical protein
LVAWIDEPDFTPGKDIMRHTRKLAVEQFESKILPTLVFVFNGNGYAAAKADNALTQSAADILLAHGDRAIQMNTPAMDGPAAFYQLANQIGAISKGRPIGLMGFSAGGTLALRLAALSRLNVLAAVSYYGPPDLRAWLSYHKGDRIFRKVTSDVQFSKGIITLLSGAIDSKARLIEAFGLRDHSVVSGYSTADFRRDFPDGQV